MADDKVKAQQLQDHLEKRITAAHKDHPGFAMSRMASGGVWWQCSCDASKNQRKEENA